MADIGWSLPPGTFAVTIRGRRTEAELDRLKKLVANLSEADIDHTTVDFTDVAGTELRGVQLAKLLQDEDDLGLDLDDED